MPKTNIEELKDVIRERALLDGHEMDMAISDQQAIILAVEYLRTAITEIVKSKAPSAN